MRRLMVMTGAAGKALLEINTDGAGAAVKYGGPGELWLFDGEGNSARGPRAPFIPVGAMAVKNGTVLLSGGFGGRKELMERSSAEALLRSQEKPRQRGGREEPSEPGERRGGGRTLPGQPIQRAPQSRALLEILQKAAELFPADMGGGQGAPQRADEAYGNEDAVNPFPEAFPFSRWKRVAYLGGGPDAGGHIPHTRPAGRVPPGKKAEGLRQVSEGEGRRRILGQGKKGTVTTTYMRMRPHLPQEPPLI